MAQSAEETEILDYSAKVLHVLEQDGEIERIQNLIARLIGESSWRDSVKRMSNKIMDQESIEDLTPESVTEMIMADAIAAVPPDVTAAVDKHIREFLTRKKVSSETATPQRK